MAQDDYDVIVFRILTYLYAVMKRKEVFQQLNYDHAIKKSKINEDYLNDVYRLMANEGLIEGTLFKETWGTALIPLFDEKDLRITAKGIHYLEDNDKMKAVGKFLLDKADDIVKLVATTGLEYLLH